MNLQSTLLLNAFKFIIFKSYQQIWSYLINNGVKNMLINAFSKYFFIYLEYSEYEEFVYSKHLRGKVWVYRSKSFFPSQSTIYMFSMPKHLSTNLQFFIKLTVDSTLNIGSNLQSTFNCPPP